MSVVRPCVLALVRSLFIVLFRSSVRSFFFYFFMYSLYVLICLVVYFFIDLCI